MAIQDSLDNLLIKMHGKVHLKDAYEWLGAKYSIDTIQKYIAENSDKYEIRKDYILSEDLQIESFILKLKDLLRDNSRRYPDLYRIIIYKYATAFEPAFTDQEMELKIQHIESNSKFILYELDHLLYPLDLDYYFNRKTRYKFTSRLFEFLLSEEFRGYGLYTTPTSIVQLFVKLLPNIDEARVYNPAAGILNLVTALEVNSTLGIDIRASEIDRKIFEYGRLFAEINQLELNYNCTDSCDEISDLRNESYDVIVSNLPFGAKIHQTYFPERRYTELALHIISESLKKLNESGKAVFLVNEGILYANSRQGKDFRREIIESGRLKSIITLPTKILLHSSVKTCLLVFDKVDYKEHIKYVDASTEDYYITNRDKSITLEVDKIISLLEFSPEAQNVNVEEPKGKYAKKSSLHILSFQEIRNNNYDLSLGRYILNLANYGKEYTPLKSFLKPLSAIRVREGVSVPYVRISELNGNKLDADGKLGVNTTRKRGRLLDEPAFLIGTVGGSFKPTYFDGSFVIEVSDNIVIYTFNNREVYPEYLIQELNAEYVFKQMNLLAKGSVIRSISRADLASVKVKFPSFEDQKRIYSARIDFSEPYIQTTTTTSSAVTSTTTTIPEERTITDTDIFQTFKHEIGNILKGPEGFFDLLPQFLSRNKIDMDTPIVETEPDTIGEMLEMSTAKINQVYDVMENMKGILFSDEKYFKPTKIELIPFIEKCLKREITNGNIKWTILINESATSTRKIFVEIDTNQFEYVVRNMVVNIERHGGHKKTINLLVNVVTDKEKTLIEFINDGEPLPANFNISDYIQYGKKSGDSTGQGLGGYLINRVVKNHGGEIDILPSGKKFKTSSGTIEATVHFSISIPKIL